MSIRIRRSGAAEYITDHKDLLNKGTHSHDEIDTYLAEVDEARGSYMSLAERIKAGAADPATTARLSKVEIELAAARDTYTSLDARLDNLPAGSGGSGGSGGGGGGGSIAVKQTAKLNVIAPYEQFIDVTASADYAFLPVEVLKFVPGESNQVMGVYNFDNTDAANFEESPTVLFNGEMSLPSTHLVALKSEGVLGDGMLYACTIDLALFRSVAAIEVKG